MGACRLSSSPWAGGDPASCRASSSSEGQSSWAEVVVEPCCRAGTWVRPALVQVLVGGSNRVRGPGAEGTADFVTPDYVAAAAAATAAAASGAAPEQETDVKLKTQTNSETKQAAQFKFLSFQSFISFKI